jgi:hypothetical protein
VTGRFRFRRPVGPSATHLAVDYYAGDRLWVTGGATGAVYVVSQQTGRVLRRLRLQAPSATLLLPACPSWES